MKVKVNKRKRKEREYKVLTTKDYPPSRSNMPLLEVEVPPDPSPAGVSPRAPRLRASSGPWSVLPCGLASAWNAAADSPRPWGPGLIRLFAGPWRRELGSWGCGGPGLRHAVSTLFSVRMCQSQPFTLLSLHMLNRAPHMVNRDNRPARPPLPRDIDNTSAPALPHRRPHLPHQIRRDDPIPRLVREGVHAAERGPDASDVEQDVDAPVEGAESCFDD
jgi:hypothetical protein